MPLDDFYYDYWIDRENNHKRLLDLVDYLKEHAEENKPYSQIFIRRIIDQCDNTPMAEQALIAQGYLHLDEDTTVWWIFNFNPTFSS
jgi:hypothetical protein